MEFMSSLQGGLDEHKPSLFELLSEQQLSSLIPPSLRYLLVLATQRHPRYLLRILNSFDELYALASLLIERYYLKTYGGGFTENFYGLKRERVLRIRGGEAPRAQLSAPTEVREALRLRERDVWKNLAIMVGLPYLKSKLDEHHDLYAPSTSLLQGAQFNRDALPPNPTIKQRVMHYYKWFLRHVYPSVNAAYYFAILAFNLAYLFDGSKFHNPFLWIIGSRIRRLGQADYRAFALAEQKSASSSPTQTGKTDSGAKPGQTNSIFSPHYLANAAYPRLLDSLKILLPTSIFALKFLEWWHASDFARQLARKATEGLELPPPVITQAPTSANGTTPPSSLKNGNSPTRSQTQHRAPISSLSNLPIFTVPLPARDASNLCAICLGPIVTATATPYGYVFCYGCIHRWVEGVNERQLEFMEGGSKEEADAWIDEQATNGEDGEIVTKSREGRWESGKGRCAISGKRLLGGTEALRRVVV